MPGRSHGCADAPEQSDSRPRLAVVVPVDLVIHPCLHKFFRSSGEKPVRKFVFELDQSDGLVEGGVVVVMIQSVAKDFELELPAPGVAPLEFSGGRKTAD
jgi:hypothetical protein